MLKRFRLTELKLSTLCNLGGPSKYVYVCSSIFGNSFWLSLLLQDNDYICNQLTSRYALADILKVQVPPHIPAHVFLPAISLVTSLQRPLSLSCFSRVSYHVNTDSKTPRWTAAGDSSLCSAWRPTVS